MSASPTSAASQPCPVSKFGQWLREKDRVDAAERKKQHDQMLKDDLPLITEALTALKPVTRDGFTVRTLSWSRQFAEGLYSSQGLLRARLEQWATEVGLTIQTGGIVDTDGSVGGQTFYETGVDFMYD